MVPFLYHDRATDDMPAGHTVNSRGFKKKILDNPVMNADSRSLGIVGTTDGVPYFDDQKRGGWPFILRVANLQDGLSTHISNCHLHMLSANEYWDLDTDANVLRRRVHAPKSLNAHLSIVVDDLLYGYHKGEKHFIIPLTQHSRPFVSTLFLYCRHNLNICRHTCTCVDVHVVHVDIT